MSYTPNFQEVYRRLGVYADRILHGAKPEDLPVMFRQNGTWFSTSRTLGLTVPWELRAVANKVIT